MFQDKQSIVIMKCNILKHSIVKYWQMHFTIFSELKDAYTHILDG